MSSSHLTIVPGSILLAWHSTQNIQAIRLHGLDCLYVNGRRMDLDLRNDFGPVQAVINACRADLTASDLERRYGEGAA